MKNIVKSFGFVLMTAVMALGFASCQQSTEYKTTKGEPVIKYIITTDAAASDSIISEAFTESVICIVGDNLRSVKKVFFNDREAVLSPSFINNHTLILSVPSSLPDEITNKIYFHAENGNIVDYPFKVNAPGPSINGIDCEFHLPGEEAVLTGNYFVDNASIPLEVIMPDGKSAEIKSFEQTKVTFVVPEGCTESGQIKVITAYGEGKSSFYFNDDRNIVVDFDGSHGGNADGGGWRWGADHKHKPGTDPAAIPAIDGDFLLLGGHLDQYGGWNDNGFEFDIWGVNLLSQPKFAAMVANNKLEDLCVKFEAYVPSAHPWGVGGLQFIWMGDDAASNSKHSDPTFPRGMWRPWVDGMYDTGDKWVTVTIPFTEFCYDQKYNKISTMEDVSLLNGLTIFVLEGSADGGKECDPWIAIDNIRVVPVK